AQRRILADEKAKALSDIQRLQDATKRMLADADYRTGEKARLEEDLQGFQREVQVLNSYLQQLAAEGKQTATALATSKAHMAQLAAAITALQLQNARAASAQSGADALTE